MSAVMRYIKELERENELLRELVRDMNRMFGGGHGLLAVISAADRDELDRRMRELDVAGRDG